MERPIWEDVAEKVRFCRTKPLKAIRAKCLDCCCGQPKEVERCSAKDCFLHPFRFGKHPPGTTKRRSGNTSGLEATRARKKREVQIEPVNK